MHEYIILHGEQLETFSVQVSTIGIMLHVYKLNDAISQIHHLFID